MSDYTPTFNGSTLEALQAPINAADHDVELAAIATAIATKANIITSPSVGKLIKQTAGGDLASSAITAALLTGLTGPVQAQIDNKVLYPAVSTPSGHVRCGNMYIQDGSEETTLIPTEDPVVWETIGPTGAGADKEWTALDHLVALGATAVILAYSMEMSITANSYTPRIRLYAAEYGHEDAQANNNFVLQTKVSAETNNHNHGASTEFVLPIDSAGRFAIRTNPAAYNTIQHELLYYKGFII